MKLVISSEESFSSKRREVKQNLLIYFTGNFNMATYQRLRGASAKMLRVFHRKNARDRLRLGAFLINTRRALSVAHAALIYRRSLACVSIAPSHLSSIYISFDKK